MALPNKTPNFLEPITNYDMFISMEMDPREYYQGQADNPYSKHYGSIELVTLSVLLEILAELKAKASK